MLVNKKCTYCGKKFQARTTKTKYCSHTCNQKHYKHRAKNERIKALKTNGVLKEEVVPFKDQLEIIKIKDYLSVEDCATLLNVSRSTIKRLISQGELASFNVFSRVLISRKDLNLFCESELKKPVYREKVVKVKSNKEKFFNVNNYYYMGEVTEYYNVSLKSIERHIKSNNINKIKKGRFSYVLKSDIKKLFGAPNKT
ncbi:helix-turn-helix domain-containing protein [Pseudotamlana agarivorans]|uniref:helix-turn-helix domain-containing protein n=1 Tax=Pseudotamlana agarivorans TaxID=481183 RepID=UPI000835A5D5|nr:helix-turn-helix domain-containing protein [Tamlana agarivorans]